MRLSTGSPTNSRPTQSTCSIPPNLAAINHSKDGGGLRVPACRPMQSRSMRPVRIAGTVRMGDRATITIGVGREQARRLCQTWTVVGGQQAADDAGRHPRGLEKSSTCGPTHTSQHSKRACLPGVGLHDCCQAGSECYTSAIRILRKLPASLRFYGLSTRTCIRAFACIATMGCRQSGLDMGSMYSRGCRSRIPRSARQL